jgi:hypothetical protein
LGRRVGSFNWVDYPERLKEFSEKRKGDGNPMHGKSHSESTRKRLARLLRLIRERA